MSLSDRIRPNCEAAAWVCEEVKQLERENTALKQRILDDNKAYGCEIRDPSGTIWDHAQKLQKENAALRERLHNADAEIDMWASRCAAAIWMLPEQVTGGQLREAQDKFHRMLHAERKEAQP